MRIPFREISESKPEAQLELSERNYSDTWRGIFEPGVNELNNYLRSKETSGRDRSRQYHKEVIVK